jgi:hypothetical protein
MALAEREKIITVMHVTVTRSGTRAKVDYRTAIADEQWVEEQIDRDAIAAYARDLSRYLEIMDWLEKIGDQPHPRKATWKRMADHLFKSAEISHEAILPPDPPPFAEEIRKAVEKADRWYRRLHSVNA